ncbi:MAG: ATP-binding protein [Gammaproteobacteria bacterium]|mgnify:CR=1 FL=1|nr:ATP-binding protein [Gammaproteobacteria bacterium]MBU1602453.1 ATP-binding protein [Gammaproteobacteria bacterium]MBU2433258.1 ATP-binding protein [Gammaproteobacteria bacterium]MBU2451174.1 ATP-binding protein [Gammaproteobacteria bacterium]
MSTIRPKDRDALIQSLRAGVVPRTGQHLVQVGRVKELEALMRDVERIADSGSGFRVVIGEYGSGKTFFLNLVRAIALEKKLVTMHADLNPDRRLHASGGQARSLYAELTKNMATRTKPEGGALAGVVEKFVAQAKTDAKAGGTTTEEVIRERLGQLAEMVNGYDFAEVIAAYCRGFDEGNEQLKADAIRWLRGEFSTKTDARAALGVRTIVDDTSVYDQLKLLARFIRLAGYSGLMVCLDELVNLYKLANTQARNSNYEQILRILNDSLQGSAEGLGFVLGGTPEFLLDTRRGLYSYAALQSRLAENTFARAGMVDYSGPVMRLASLTPEDFYVLLHKLRHVYASGDAARYLMPDEAIPAFMEHCASRLGEAYFRTPRTTITAFINLLAVLEQNPDVDWQELIGSTEVASDDGGAEDLSVQEDDELASFQL